MPRLTQCAAQRFDTSVELFVVWLLASSFIGLLSALAGCFLAPQVCLLGAFLTLLYALKTKRAEYSSEQSIRWSHVVGLLLITLFFRLPAYNYVLGGQDEGLYVNMSHHIVRTGGISVHDRPLQRLDGSRYKSTYLSENRSIAEAGPHGVRGDYLAGVYIRSVQGGRLQFQFYHLFPVWMAIVGGVFGGASGLYALTLFALLSVLFMYRLALLLTGSPRSALVAGGLLAINPLHAFFSKFPVTEVQVLAFSLMGFTYLTKYWSAARSERASRWLVISAGCFGALFVTHIRGFMYVPLIAVVGMMTMLVDGDEGRAKAVVRWAMGCIGLYVLSAIYGLRWSHTYADDIYRGSFEKLFGHYWVFGIAAIVVGLCLAWGGVCLAARYSKNKGFLNRAVGFARLGIGAVLVLALGLGLFRIYQLGWTHHFAGNSGLSQVWHLVHKHWLSAKASSLWALFIYVGPFIFAGLFYFGLRRRSDPRHEFLRLFVCVFAVYGIALQWVLPYQPYYARYLLSELVPYLILFVVVCWSSIPKGFIRASMALALALSGVYMASATTLQLGKNESAGLQHELARLLRPVDKRDVVLLDSLSSGLPDNNELKTPILYTFGLHAISITRQSLHNDGYLAAISAKYQHVFLISPHPQAPPGFVKDGSEEVKVWAYRWNHSLPRHLFVREDMLLYRFRLNHLVFPTGVPQSFAKHGIWNTWLSNGWSQPENWGVWSIGKHSVLVIDSDDLPHSGGALRIHLNINALVTKKHPMQRVRLEVDGATPEVYKINYPNKGGVISFDVTSNQLKSHHDVHVEFWLPDAVSPKSLGINGDPRVLAIGLKSITIEHLPMVDKQR